MLGDGYVTGAFKLRCGMECGRRYSYMMYVCMYAVDKYTPILFVFIAGHDIIDSWIMILQLEPRKTCPCIIHLVWRKMIAYNILMSNTHLF